MSHDIVLFKGEGPVMSELVLNPFDILNEICLKQIIWCILVSIGYDIYDDIPWPLTCMINHVNMTVSDLCQHATRLF